MNKLIKQFYNLMLAALFFLIAATQTYSQSDCGNRYKEKTFSSIQIFRNVVYSKNAPKLIAASLGTETVVGRDLVMDIFMPPPTDTVLERPVVIVAHGGGFIDVAFMGGTLLVGTKDNDDVQALCDTLAHWGYVTACIEYRTGFDVASTTSIKRAVWRGAQDMSAAMRFFRKNASWFNIDPDKIFIGGSSAGAFCAIHSTFADYQERIPETYQQSLFMADLGAMHSRPVVALNGFNPFTGNNTNANDVDSLPTALVSFWGAIADTTFIAGNNRAPIKMFHGNADPVVSAQCAQPFASVVLAAPVCCGSEIMNIALNSRNVPHEYTLEDGQGHEYWGALNGMWMPNSPNNFWLPMIQSSSSFFYEYMRPTAALINGPQNCNPNTLYTYNVTNPIPGADYCWEVNSGNIVSSNTNASSIDVIFNSGQNNATVYCTVRDKSDLLSNKSQKSVNIVNPASVGQLLTEELFTFYPNPGKGFLTLELKTEPTNEESIFITDILGKIIYQTDLTLKTNYIDISHFNKGNYHIYIYHVK